MLAQEQEIGEINLLKKRYPTASVHDLEQIKDALELGITVGSGVIGSSNEEYVGVIEEISGTALAQVKLDEDTRSFHINNLRLETEKEKEKRLKE